MNIEALYFAFRAYPLRDRIDSCPCCRGPASTRPLHQTPLRQLSAEVLSTYAFRALTTVGNVDDFRHFLPRIFELLYSGELAAEVDPEIVLGKLAYADWTSWPAAEQDAVRAALHLLWQRFRLSPEAKNWLCAIARAEPDIRPYLNAWEPAAAAAFKADPHTECVGFWEDAESQWLQVLAWRQQ